MLEISIDKFTINYYSTVDINNFRKIKLII